MSGDNLTRDEARARAALLEVSSYAIDLDLTDGGGKPGDRTFRSLVEVTFTAREAGATHLDLVADAVRSAELDGTPLDPGTAFDGGRLVLDLEAGDHVLRVDADCRYSRSGEGLHRFVDPVDGGVYLYSQFETFDAHRMYGCFDQPDLKATFTMTVLAPADWEVVTNAAAATEPVEGEGGAMRHTFATTPPMSTYITAVVAGPYAVVRSEHDGIPLGLYCRASLAEHLDADALFEVTRQGFDFYHRVFGYRYPFGKYDQLFVPEFNAGAMENAGAVTFLEDYVFRSKVTDAAYSRRAETVLHEMAHMWFGDLVTMRWWDDLWLNESFATYASVLCQAEATRWDNAWTTFANAEKVWAYRQDQLPSTHPIVADMVDIESVRLNFDGITYAKGASVLKQLVAYVGREEFLTALRQYFRTHEYGNTSLRDLLVELERASGRDLSAWSKEWLETAGVSTLRPELAVDDDDRFTSFTIVQTAPEDHPTLRSHRLAVGLYDRVDGALQRRARYELDVTGAETEVTELIGERRPALLLVNDDDLAYTKIRLDERSVEVLLDGISDIADSLPRTLCWTAAWDMARDAELAAADYLRLVLGGVGQESDIGVVQTLLRQATTAGNLYTRAADRPSARERLADATAALLDTAPPASDHQLAFARAFVSAATSEAHLDRVAGLLDGSQPLDGLAVDTELRWHLLLSLAAGGRADEAEISAELERDPTAAGQRQAAAARAARPTEAAKEAAWTAVVVDRQLPNAVQSATISGFQQMHQEDLLAPYVSRYLDAVEEVWQESPGEMGQSIVAGLFPMLPEQWVLETVDEWLATHRPVPALRRLLSEGRDGLARMLRAQARTPSGG